MLALLNASNVDYNALEPQFKETTLHSLLVLNPFRIDQVVLATLLDIDGEKIWTLMILISHCWELRLIGRTKGTEKVGSLLFGIQQVGWSWLPMIKSRIGQWYLNLRVQTPLQVSGLWKLRIRQFVCKAVKLVEKSNAFWWQNGFRKFIVSTTRNCIPDGQCLAVCSLSWIVPHKLGSTSNGLCHKNFHERSLKVYTCK